MKSEHKILGQRRQSRFDPNLAEKIEAWDREMTIKEEAERLRREREDRLKPKVAEEAKPSVLSGAGYVLMDRTSTYALGVHALRKAYGNAHPTFVKKDGSAVYRPLTFEENIRARLDDYNTLNNPDGSARSDEDRLGLFGIWLNSCTGIAYKAGSTLFKIITQSEDLVYIDKGFNSHYIGIDYSELHGVELDSSQGTYNQWLSQPQVMDHSAWNEAVADKPLLNEYVNLVFRLRNGSNMGFWVWQNTLLDQLRELCVDNTSDAGGDGNLNCGCRFVRVTLAKNPIAYSQML